MYGKSKRNESTIQYSTGGEKQTQHASISTLPYATLHATHNEVNTTQVISQQRKQLQT